ncbi:10734_t:CDS:1, partial [Racocetra persica]
NLNGGGCKRNHIYECNDGSSQICDYGPCTNDCSVNVLVTNEFCCPDKECKNCKGQ